MVNNVHIKLILLISSAKWMRLANVVFDTLILYLTIQTTHVVDGPIQLISVIAVMNFSAKRHSWAIYYIIRLFPQESLVYTPNAPIGFYPKAPFTSYPSTSYSTSSYSPKSPFSPHTSTSWPTRVTSVISDTHRWEPAEVFPYFPFSAENCEENKSLCLFDK